MPAVCSCNCINRSDNNILLDSIERSINIITTELKNLIMTIDQTFRDIPNRDLDNLLRVREDILDTSEC